MEKIGGKETTPPGEPYWLKRTREIYGKIKTLSNTQLKKRMYWMHIQELKAAEDRHSKGVLSDEEFWKEIHETLHASGIYDTRPGYDIERI